MERARALVPYPAKPRRDYELAFLPAVLEVTETPPSPVGRAIGAVIVATFSLCLLWACLGHVDIVATAAGKIVPDDRTKLIQPLESGTVRAIHIRDGQRVEAGQVLIELDPTVSQADVGRIDNDLVNARLDIARYRAAIADPQHALDRFTPPAQAPHDLVETQRQFLATQTWEEAAKIAEFDGQLAQKQAERDEISESIEKLNATVPLLAERVDVHKTLYDQKLFSKVAYLTELQELVGQQHDLNIYKIRYRQADAAFSALKDAKAKGEAEYRRTLFDQLTQAEQKEAQLLQELVKAKKRTSLTMLTAPVDGVVQQLGIHTVGGVVTAAQTLAVVVPAQSPLEIEAMISNRDIGFVAPGQAATIKVDAFNFTRYGVLHGRILSISRDSIARNETADRATSAENPSFASQAEGQSPLYAARVSLDRPQISIDGRPVALTAGMTVTVEVRTGSRRVISYLLSPMAQYRQEALRER